MSAKRPNEVSTITPEQKQAITDLLAKIPHLVVGIGTEDAPCSIAAINLALTRELTDKIPECMSEVVGNWIIVIQDGAPPELCRDHPRWRELLPLAAGTGRELEAERLQVVIGWMWGVLALPVVVDAVPDPAKDAWAEMLDKRTTEAARVAADAACVANGKVSYAVYAARLAIADAARVSAYAADDAAHAATHAAAYAVGPSPWPAINPVGLLEQLIEIGVNNG